MMKKLFIPLVITALLALPALRISAWDWGLLLDNTASLESVDADTGSQSDGFLYSGTLIPWFSSPLGTSGKLYLSAGATADYEKENWTFIPELLRTELSFRSNSSGLEFRAGRMLYADPLGFIAGGLFDGARLSRDFSFGAMGIGVWYTGLLYKENAQITMTNDDLVSYYSDLDYSNFADTYFASRRLMFALDWDYPDMKEWLRFRMAYIGQLDLNGRDESYSSHYLAVKAGIPISSFTLDLGGCVTLAQITDINDDKQIKIGLAGELGIGWALPTSIQDRLSFTGRFSSGTVDSDGKLAAFVPITTVSQGDVLKAKLSGLSMLRLDYTARLHESFSFTLASSYFILSDLGTWQGFLTERDGYLLGNEFSGHLIWSPVSDLRLNLGGGVFLPSMGNADPKADPIWRIDLNAVLLIF